MLRHLIPTKGGALRPLGRFEEEMERLIERVLGRGEDGWWETGAFLPMTDVAETDTTFEVVAELPGVKPEEVRVEVKEGMLWITGEKKEEKEEKGKAFHRVERRHGAFRRVIPLPGAIDEEKIEAKFAEGVLRVVVPKGTKALPRAVKVNAG